MGGFSPHLKENPLLFLPAFTRHSSTLSAKKCHLGAHFVTPLAESVGKVTESHPDSSLRNDEKCPYLHDFCCCFCSFLSGRPIFKTLFPSRNERDKVRAKIVPEQGIQVAIYASRIQVIF
jgi:hypothetical protein